MVNQLITIGEAADIVNKSAQTIRRLIKGNKIKFKRKRTPQGFNYVVDKASLLEFFQLLKNSTEAVESPLQTPTQTTSQQEAAYPSETPIQQKQPVNEIYILEAEDVVIHDNMSDDQREESASTSQQPIQTPVTNNQQVQSQNHISAAAQQAERYTNDIIEKLIDQHRQDKEKLYQLLEVFQNRIVGLEEHIRLLQAPKKKWWQRLF